MRIRLLVEVVVAGLLLGFAAAAGEPSEPQPGEATIEGALAEPADPDDAADVLDDNNPNDVGQQALEPGQAATPDPGRPTGAEGAAPDIDADIDADWD